jgi:hypothetical protein
VRFQLLMVVIMETAFVFDVALCGLVGDRPEDGYSTHLRKVS